MPRGSENDPIMIPKMIPKWYQSYFNMISKWSPNDPKFVPKWCQNYSKMIPKWSQHDPMMLPKWSKNDPKGIPKWSQMIQKSSQNYSQNDAKISEKVIRRPSKTPSKNTPPQNENVSKKHLKMMSQKWSFFTFKGFVPKGAPGWSRGPSQVPKVSPKVPEWSPQNIKKL